MHEVHAEIVSDQEKVGSQKGWHSLTSKLEDIAGITDYSQANVNIGSQPILCVRIAL